MVALTYLLWALIAWLVVGLVGVIVDPMKRPKMSDTEYWVKRDVYDTWAIGRMLMGLFGLIGSIRERRRENEWNNKTLDEKNQRTRREVVNDLQNIREYMSANGIDTTPEWYLIQINGHTVNDADDPVFIPQEYKDMGLGMKVWAADGVYYMPSHARHQKKPTLNKSHQIIKQC